MNICIMCRGNTIATETAEETGEPLCEYCYKINKAIRESKKNEN